MATKNLDIIISAKDEATSTLNKFSASVTNLAKDAAVGSGIIVGALGLIAKNVIELGGNMEQTRIAFESMLGNGDKAGKLMEQISDFAAKTPFDLPQVQEGAKRLLAYNIAAEDIIPTFTTLGNIASAVGSDKLPQLILAFGQVKAATHLTGMELRQFSEAGVPLLQALVDQANATGGVLSQIGGVSAKTKKKFDSLSESVSNQEYRLKLMKKAGKDGSDAYKILSRSIDQNKDKIKDLGDVGPAVFGKVKVSAEDMINKISDGTVSFDEVQKALNSIGGAGGKWGDLMAKQSTTFLGTLSNTRDEFVRFTLDVIGFNKDGTLRDNSIFFYLKKAMESFLSALQQARPIVQGFFDYIVGNTPAITAGILALSGAFLAMGIAMFPIIAPAVAIMAVFGALGYVAGLLIDYFGGIEVVSKKLGDTVNWLKEQWDQIYPQIKAIADLLTEIFLPVWETLKQEIIIIGQELQKLAVTLGISKDIWEILGKVLLYIIVGAVTVLIAILVGLGALLIGLAKIIDTVILPALQKFADMQAFITEKTKGTITAINSFLDGWSKLSSLKNISLSLTGKNTESHQHGGFVDAPVGQAVPALLHGGERVVPRVGTDVNPGTGGSGGITINFTGAVSMDSPERIQQLADKVINILGRQNELAAKGIVF